MGASVLVVVGRVVVGTVILALGVAEDLDVLLVGDG